MKIKSERGGKTKPLKKKRKPWSTAKWTNNFNPLIFSSVHGADPRRQNNSFSTRALLTLFPLSHHLCTCRAELSRLKAKSGVLGLSQAPGSEERRDFRGAAAALCAAGAKRHWTPVCVPLKKLQTDTVSVLSSGSWALFVDACVWKHGCARVRDNKPQVHFWTAITTGIEPGLIRQRYFTAADTCWALWLKIEKQQIS